MNTMVKRLVGWFVLLPLCILLVVFSLANRHVIEVQFDPFLSRPPLVPSLEVPLFLVIYAVLIFGIILGGTAAWLAQGGHRRRGRRWHSRARQLEEEKARAQREAREKDPGQRAFLETG